MRRLPPLDALRAFDAAARHLSFTRAAEEIHVTQAAISHRVRALEIQLQANLFRRLTRKLELTDRGEMLASAVRRGLDEIARGVAALDSSGHADGPLRVSILPSFAQRWLIPRLAGFHALRPDIQVRVLADHQLADLHAGTADLAIRFGRGRYPGLHAEFLMGDSVMPVCSPAFLQGKASPDRLETVMQYPLLHDSECGSHVSGEDWSHWLAYVGRPDLRCDIGQHFSNAALTLGAAAAGLGVALGRRSLIEDDLASGRLVPAWPVAAPTLFAYWLVCLPERLDTSALAAFRGWLLDEVQAYMVGTRRRLSI